MKLFPLNSSQTIAAVAVTLALAAGAYALGRSQSGPIASTAPLESPVSSSAAPALVETKVAAAEPVLAAEPAPAPKAAALCADCMRVLSVHVEQRKAESGSGVGAEGGAVIGGLLGNRIGGGTGRKLATVGGAVAGGYAGNEIEKNTNKKRVWIVEVKTADGHIRHRGLYSDPQLQQGDIVTARDGRLVRRG